MSKIKFFILPVLLFLSACAPKTNLVTDSEPVRNYPVFLTGMETSAVFKVVLTAGDYKNNFLLMINKHKYNDFQLKIIGDYASVLLNADFKDGKFTYTYKPKDIFNKTALGVFEDTVKILLVKPSNFVGYIPDSDGGIIRFKSGKFINSYYFKRGLSYPYMMKQAKGRINKNIEFQDYRVFGDRPLPYRVILTEAKGRAGIELSLLSIK